ncbi:MAG: hypothetical protein EOO43_00505 [Flavobacterium sp.]|nr:MAG: hypothetical protein EOO43_00505 [Flavobacterium sp.]
MEIPTSDYNKALVFAERILKRPEYKSLRQIVKSEEIVTSAYLYYSESSVHYTFEILTQYLSKSINIEYTDYIRSCPKRYKDYRKKRNEYKRKCIEMLTDSYLRSYLKYYGKNFSKESIIEARRRIILKRQNKTKYEIIEYRFPELPKGFVLVSDIPGFADCIGYCISADGIFSCRNRGYLLHDFWTPIKLAKLNMHNTLLTDKGERKLIKFSAMLKRAIETGLIKNTQ